MAQTGVVASLASLAAVSLKFSRRLEGKPPYGAKWCRAGCRPGIIAVFQYTKKGRRAVPCSLILVIKKHEL